MCRRESSFELLNEGDCFGDVSASSSLVVNLEPCVFSSLSLATAGVVSRGNLLGVAAVMLEVIIGFEDGAEEEMSSKYRKSLVRGFEALGNNSAGMLSLSSYPLLV